MNNTIELISIGTELLSGRTLNSHAQTLGSALTAMGLRLSRDTTIPDQIETIQSTVHEAFKRTDIVIVSGGLGPTSDDMTREALAELFGCRIVMSPAALEAIKARYAARGINYNPVSGRMAQILEGAAPLLNSAGAAVAQRMDLPEGKTLFIVPGPPREFAAVLDDHIAPWLAQTFPNASPLELRVLTTKGIGESDIVTQIEAAGFQPLEIDVGFYPGLGKVEIRMTAPKEQTAALDVAERTLRELLQHWLID